MFRLARPGGVVPLLAPVPKEELHMKSSWRMRALAAGVLVVGIGTSACFGPFNATRQVYAFNKDVSENRWAQEGVFLAFAILPVYGFAMLGDAIIFNTIEWWSGDNPIGPPTMADARTFEQDGHTVTLARTDAGMRMTIEENGCVAQELHFVDQADSPTRVLDAQGTLVAQAVTLADGRVEVSDSTGALIGRF